VGWVIRTNAEQSTKGENAKASTHVADCFCHFESTDYDGKTTTTKRRDCHFIFDIGWFGASVWSGRLDGRTVQNGWRQGCKLVSPRIPTTMGSSPRIPMSYSLSSISPSLRCLNGSEAGRSDSRWMRERREPQILLYLPGGHCQPQDDSSPAGRNEKVYVLVIIFSILDMIPTHHFDLSHRRILLPLSCELSSAGVHDK
jgi:hypothetical protein